MAEVYSTPTNSSPGPTEEASLDVLAQEEMDGMVSRLKSLVEAGAIPSKVGALFEGALPGFPADEDAQGCSVAVLGQVVVALVGSGDFNA